jgi:DNA polymerase-3 subunit gamma/tau
MGETPRPLPQSVIAASPDLEGWRAALAAVRARRPALASVLEHAALLRFGPERVELGYEAGSFLVGQAADASARELLLSALGAHFGRTPELAFETIAPKSGNVTLAMLETSERKTKLDAAKRAVAEHPLVAAAIELLGAELRDVRLAEAET